MINYIHIFDKASLNYASETGVYYGRCKTCGKGLSIYTGGQGSIPEGVRRYEVAWKPVAGSMTWLGGNILLCDYSVAVNGKPNAIIEYDLCT